ncbi:Txe/YoeB family addiction module toxin [Limosilactobacillus gastricus]|uniref:Txe/YoeB family addiction module toxin n=1 Tax=Limosilactobacillus gastricus TaxID=227942 RepID=UPI001F46B01E
MVDQLKNNPCQYNQSFEKLVSPILGFYSRRINVQHRVVYKVNGEMKEVVIYSAWGRYD